MRISDWSSDVCSSDLEVLAQDQVDHAADRVGAVDRRGAVGEHFDALDSGQRDGVEVGTGAGGERRLRGAVAVDQDQGALAAEAAQVGERAGLGRASRLRAELADRVEVGGTQVRSKEHTSELQSLMRNSYAVFCMKKK